MKIQKEFHLNIPHLLKVLQSIPFWEIKTLKIHSVQPGVCKNIVLLAARKCAFTYFAFPFVWFHCFPSFFDHKMTCFRTSESDFYL